MGTTIDAGSHVLLDDAPAPRLGEIWAWCADDGTVVVHRSLGRDRHGYRFQGDGRIDRDPPVAPDRIIGRVRQVRYRDHLWIVGWKDRVFRTARLIAADLTRVVVRRLLPRGIRQLIRGRRP